MVRKESKRIITSVDIGTTKICVLVAQVVNQKVEILGVGQAPSDGLRKGVIVDVPRAVSSIKNAIKKAEKMSGRTIKKVTVGISGSHVYSINSCSSLELSHGRVGKKDINEVVAAAKNITLKPGEQILHALPQYFTVDDDQQLLDPIGMHGLKLETKVHIVIGSTASVQNIIECCQEVGLIVEDIVLEQIASSYAVLSPDEKQLGAALLDIGGGTSDLALYKNGSIVHTAVLPVAGNHFTNDLAIGLRITLAEAERIKKSHGQAVRSSIAKDEHIEVKEVDGHNAKIVLLSDLVHILQARSQELLEWVNKEIMSHDSRISIASGLIITGGGSLLKGLDVVARKICCMPVRIGEIKLDDKLYKLNSPMYATGYGLLIYALHNQDLSAQFSGAFSAKTVMSRMKSWISGLYTR